MTATKKQERATLSVGKVAFVLLLIVSLVFIYKSGLVTAVPAGASIVSNVTGSGSTYSADNRSDAGGTITTMVLNVTQQNDKWKAYVGNVSGVLTLDDVNANTIFQWAMSDSEITGEVYASRALSPGWASINCSNVTLIETEDSTLGFTASALDNINTTFNETTHTSFIVAGITIQTDTCRGTATYVNDSKQNINTAFFQEIVLGSGTDVIFASKLNKDVASFFNESIVDFQLILPDDVSAAASTYYFFVELGS